MISDEQLDEWESHCEEVREMNKQALGRDVDKNSCIDFAPKLIQALREEKAKAFSLSNQLKECKKSYKSLKNRNIELEQKLEEQHSKASKWRRKYWSDI